MSATSEFLTTIRNTALAQLVGCEQALFDYQMRFVLDDFLTHTCILTESLPVTVVENIDTYALTPATPGALVVALLSVWNGSIQLSPGNARFLPPGSTGEPAVACMLDATNLKLWPTPPAGFTSVVLAARVALTIPPSGNNALVIPAVCHPWFTALLDGVLARLYGLPDKPWTSNTNMIMRQAAYVQKRLDARMAATTARTPGVQNWRFRRFGR